MRVRERGWNRPWFSAASQEMEPPGCFVFRLACAGLFGETDVKYDESPHDSLCPITSTACTEMYQSERVPLSPKTGVGKGGKFRYTNCTPRFSGKWWILFRGEFADEKEPRKCCPNNPALRCPGCSRIPLSGPSVKEILSFLSDLYFCTMNRAFFSFDSSFNQPYSFFSFLLPFFFFLLWKEARIYFLSLIILVIIFHCNGFKIPTYSHIALFFHWDSSQLT